MPHAFIWSVGIMEDLGVLPTHSNSRALAISGSGAVAGTSFKASNPTDNRMFVWHNGLMRDVNAILSPPGVVFLSGAFIKFDANENITANGVGSNGAVAVVLRPMFAPPSDANFDCHVNVNDLLLVINEWGKTKSDADVNHDQTIDVSDLLQVISDWD